MFGQCALAHNFLAPVLLALCSLPSFHGDGEEGKLSVPRQQVKSGPGGWDKWLFGLFLESHHILL